MRTFFPAFFLLCLSGAAVAPAQETMPAGITCCDEQKIRLAMAEEALQRIAAKHAGESGAATDYVSDQAYEKIRRRLPAGTRERLLDFLRAALLQPALDENIREFQERVGCFVLGMTLEIGHTLQDEYDQALAGVEKTSRLLAELESSPAARDEELGRALFHADLSERDLRRLRALDRRWKEPPAEASAFDLFNLLKKLISDRGPDPDQQMVFGLAERYRYRFPFLDEFLEKYRRIASDIREKARRINALLSASGS